MAQKRTSNLIHIFIVRNFLYFLPPGLLSTSPDMTRACPPKLQAHMTTIPAISDRLSDQVKSCEFLEVLCQTRVDDPTRKDVPAHVDDPTRKDGPTHLNSRE